MKVSIRVVNMATKNVNDLSSNPVYWPDMYMHLSLQSPFSVSFAGKKLDLKKLMTEIN